VGKKFKEEMVQMLTAAEVPNFNTGKAQPGGAFDMESEF